jgi:AmmeMemoRadiSam system protein A
VRDPTPRLDEAARAEILNLARKALENYLRSGEIPDSVTSHPALQARSGAFVTLSRGGQLRGCIGHVVTSEALYRTVQRCAISAAVEDYRFPPVTSDELGAVEIEVSVLTPMRRISDVSVIEVGTHGLYIVRGMHRGLLLPQVATEHGWNRETFLLQACRKAGLPDDAWRQRSTEIHVFEAQVFGE